MALPLFGMRVQREAKGEGLARQKFISCIQVMKYIYKNNADQKSKAL